MHIGQLIRALRVERGLTQEALALEAGMATSNVSRIENGQRQPSLRLLRRLAKALGTTAASLQAASETPEPPARVVKSAAMAIRAFPGGKDPAEMDWWEEDAKEEPPLLSEDSMALLRNFRALTPNNQALALEQIKLLRRLQEQRHASASAPDEDLW